MLRTDPHCLDRFDPADPALQPRPVPARTAADLCGLLPAAEARAAVPTITTTSAPTAAGPAACGYYDNAGQTLFVVTDAAAKARAYFDDQQYSARGATDSLFLLGNSFDERAGGAWVDAASGPVELRVIPNDAGKLITEDQILVLAQLLRT